MMEQKKFSILMVFLIGYISTYSQITESNIFIEALSKGDNTTAYNMFDSVIAKKVPKDQLTTIWSGLQAQAGKYKSHGSPRIENTTTFTPCEFENVGLDLKLVFNNQKKISGFFFVPMKPTASYQKASYDDASLYTVKEIAINTNNYSLPGVLTLPVGKTNVPIAVFIHGSGPSDKDASIGPNKIFKDLAAGLAANGIASLRYDKRTKVYAASLKPDSITINEEIIEDANSAINLIKTFSEINQSEIYVLGHSLGGMVTPKMAQENSKIKGIILFAANARPLQDLILV